MKKTTKKWMKSKHLLKVVDHRYIRKYKGFINYTWIGLATAVIYIIFLWLLIDILHIPTVISSTVTVGGMFLLKYYLYKKTGFAT